MEPPSPPTVNRKAHSCRQKASKPRYANSQKKHHGKPRLLKPATKRKTRLGRRPSKHGPSYIIGISKASIPISNRVLRSATKPIPNTSSMDTLSERQISTHLLLPKRNDSATDPLHIEHGEVSSSSEANPKDDPNKSSEISNRRLINRFDCEDESVYMDFLADCNIGQPPLQSAATEDRDLMDFLSEGGLALIDRVLLGFDPYELVPEIPYCDEEDMATLPPIDIEPDAIVPVSEIIPTLFQGEAIEMDSGSGPSNIPPGVDSKSKCASLYVPTSASISSNYVNSVSQTMAQSQLISNGGRISHLGTSGGTIERVVPPSTTNQSSLLSNNRSCQCKQKEEPEYQFRLVDTPPSFTRTPESDSFAPLASSQNTNGTHHPLPFATTPPSSLNPNMSQVFGQHNWQHPYNSLQDNAFLRAHPVSASLYMGNSSNSSGAPNYMRNMQPVLPSHRNSNSLTWPQMDSLMGWNTQQIQNPPEDLHVNNVNNHRRNVHKKSSK